MDINCYKDCADFKEGRSPWVQNLLFLYVFFFHKSHIFKLVINQDCLGNFRICRSTVIKRKEIQLVQVKSHLARRYYPTHDYLTGVSNRVGKISAK